MTIITRVVLGLLMSCGIVAALVWMHTPGSAFQRWESRSMVRSQPRADARQRRQARG